MRNIWVLGFGASHIWGLTVISTLLWICFLDGDVDSPTVAKEVPVRRTSRQCSAGKENLVIDSDETDNDDDDDCIEVETSQSERSALL